jgi:hypothetical protein
MEQEGTVPDFMASDKELGAELAGEEFNEKKAEEAENADQEVREQRKQGKKTVTEHLAESEKKKQQETKPKETEIPWDDRYENMIARIDSGANDPDTAKARAWLNAGKLNSPADLEKAVGLGGVPISATELLKEQSPQEEDEFDMFSMPHQKATKEFYSHLAAAYYGGKV